MTRELANHIVVKFYLDADGSVVRSESGRDSKPALHRPESNGSYLCLQGSSMFLKHGNNDGEVLLDWVSYYVDSDWSELDHITEVPDSALPAVYERFVMPVMRDAGHEFSHMVMEQYPHNPVRVTEYMGEPWEWRDGDSQLPDEFEEVYVLVSRDLVIEALKSSK